MTQLNDIPHDTNFAHISITRTGDSRNTNYRVSQREARQNDLDIVEEANKKYTGGKYGHLVRH